MAQRPRTDATVERVIGRNAVIEAMRAGVPAIALQIARGSGRDPRVVELLRVAAEASLPVDEVSRSLLDTYGAAHQGAALVVQPFRYLHPDDLLDMAEQRRERALIIACDGVSDPRNIGAIARSAVAFGSHGLVLPQRRAAGVTSAGWKVSAGALARLPVARATNLTRTLGHCAERGMSVIGLAADGDVELAELEVRDPLILVLGGEGRGLSRLVRQSCDSVVSIRLAGGMESLNVAVAAGIALYEVSRRRLAEAAGG